MVKYFRLFSFELIVFVPTKWTYEDIMTGTNCFIYYVNRRIKKKKNLNQYYIDNNR